MVKDDSGPVHSSLCLSSTPETSGSLPGIEDYDKTRNPVQLQYGEPVVLQDPKPLGVYRECGNNGSLEINTFFDSPFLCSNVGKGL